MRLRRLQRARYPHVLPNHLKRGSDNGQSNQIEVESERAYLLAQLNEAHGSVGGRARLLGHVALVSLHHFGVALGPLQLGLLMVQFSKLDKTFDVFFVSAHHLVLEYGDLLLVEELESAFALQPARLQDLQIAPHAVVLASLPLE